MKSKFFILFLISVLSINLFSCKKYSEVKLPCIGIVTAQKLICRKEPNVNAPKLNAFNYSSPVVLIKKTDTKTTINGIENYWYQEKTTQGWIFGGYLILTTSNEDSIYRFKPSRIKCNYPCGGLSCAEQFAPYIIGNYFITYTFLTDYPEPGDPYAGIIIGEYEKDGNKYIFSKVLKLGSYYETGEWISDPKLNEKLLQSEIERYTKFKVILKKVSDSNNEYYVNENEEKVVNRKELEIKCNNKDFKEATWYESCDLTKITLADYKQIIPFDFKVK